MTRETAQKLLRNIDRIRDFAEGKEVQSRCGSEWVTFDDFEFNNPPDQYRIKPREPREFTIWANDEGACYGMPISGFEKIRVREILTDETP